MILKEISKSLKLQKLEALRGRLARSHPKWELVNDEFSKSLHGYHGEKSVDYYLSFSPLNRCYNLHNVRLHQDPHFFEMDLPVLSPSFITLVEIKSHTGTLIFDERLGQMIQSVNGVEKRYDDPLIQVERHQEQLKDWLDANRFPPIPIHSVVVISNPSTIIKFATENTSRYVNRVFHIENLPNIIKKIATNHKKQIIPKSKVIELAKLLIEKNSPSNPDILTELQIPKTHIQKGVHCPSCTKLTMIRSRRSWRCKACGHSDKNAHIQALRDYSLLIATTITNRQLRDFLNLTSRTAATNILNSMNLKKLGKNRGTVYQLPFDGKFKVNLRR